MYYMYKKMVLSFLLCSFPLIFLRKHLIYPQNKVHKVLFVKVGEVFVHRLFAVCCEHVRQAVAVGREGVLLVLCCAKTCFYLYEIKRMVL